MLQRVIFSFLPLILLITIPILLRNTDKESVEAAPGDAETLVIVTAHTEPIKYEFTRAFRRHYREKYGVDIEIDWRNVGGTSDIVRYINDRYEASFRQYYESKGGKWTKEAAEAFRNARLDIDTEAQPEALKIRREFLNSNTGIEIDLFFGGGTYDHSRFASIGYGVDAGVAEKHPEYFLPEIMPQSFAGDVIYDLKGRFYGTCLSSFGIAYNYDRVKEIGKPVENWKDLALPDYFQAIVVADPTKSGSVNKCFEMILQQAIAERVAKDGPDALPEGWLDGFLRIKLIVANSRYVTDGAGKLVREVSSGNAAASMCIDFYGLSEAEWVDAHAESSRIAYLMPKNGSAVSADPIQLLRGAPNERAAKEFIAFVLSPEGQKLWILKPGTPGGPEKYALRRPCVRRDLLEDESLFPYRSDPDYNPYTQAGTFEYHAKWTSPYFNLIRVLIKVLALDPMDDLRASWQAIIQNGGPGNNPEAMTELRKMPFPYSDAAKASGRLAPSSDFSVADVAATRREWTDFACAQYRKAEKLAREKGERK